MLELTAKEREVLQEIASADSNGICYNDLYRRFPDCEEMVLFYFVPQGWVDDVDDMYVITDAGRAALEGQGE